MQLWLQKKEQILLSEQKEVVHSSNTKAAREVPLSSFFPRLILCCIDLTLPLSEKKKQSE